MNKTSSTVIKLKQIYPGLKGNNRRIADLLIKSPELLMSHKVSDVARVCKCDAAQVIRLCQRLGFKGFTELKTHLARELIPVHSDANYEELVCSDVFEQLRSNYLHKITQSIRDTVSQLEKETVEQAVRKIHDARRIVLAGSGASHFTACDLYSKLLRMGLNAFCFADQEMQKINSALLTPDDLLIAFSFSGNSHGTIECIQTAKDNACSILLITNYLESRAARLSDLILCTAADEEKLRIGAMSSRLSQLAVIDLLVSYLTLKYPESINSNILKTYSAIQTN